jgi:hypothetical protein
MKARSRAVSSSTSRSTTPTLRRISDAGRWLDEVGLASLFPRADLVLPSLWQALAGTLAVEWGVFDEATGKHVFTPQMDTVWRWKDELPARRLACAGKHLGRWICLVAPRLVPALRVLAAERRAALHPFQLEVADALRAAGPLTAPQLRALVGAEKKALDAAVYALQRALVLTSSGAVEHEQGWGAVALDLVERRFELEPAPSADEARRELARTLLQAAGEVSAADAAGALGLRQRETREALDELVERGEASRRSEGELLLWSA